MSDTPSPVEIAAKRGPGRPRKATAPMLASQVLPEPILVTYSLKSAKETHSFRCSVRVQEGPFLVFVSREGWQEKRFYIAVSEIATLEVMGPNELIGNPAGLGQAGLNAGGVIPPNGSNAVPQADPVPQGAYSAQQTFKEMQARAMMLRSDQSRMASTVMNEQGGLEAVGVAWLDGAPAE